MDISYIGNNMQIKRYTNICRYKLTEKLNFGDLYIYNLRRLHKYMEINFKIWNTVWWICCLDKLKIAMMFHMIESTFWYTVYTLNMCKLVLCLVLFMQGELGCIYPCHLGLFHCTGTGTIAWLCCRLRAYTKAKRKTNHINRALQN